MAVTHELEIRFLWDIKNLDDYKFKTGEYINSSRFYTEDSILKSDWKLRLYPGGHDKEHLQMTVALLPLSEYEFTANCVISIVNSEREKVATLLAESTSPNEICHSHSVHCLAQQDMHWKRASSTNTLSIMCELKIFKIMSDIEQLPPPGPVLRMWSITEFKKLDTVASVHITQNRQTAILPYGQTFIQIQYYMPDPSTVAVELMDHPEVDKIWCNIVVKSTYSNDDAENIIEEDCFVDGKFSVKLKHSNPFQFKENPAMNPVIPNKFTFVVPTMLNIAKTTFPIVTANISIKFLAISLKNSFAYDFTTPKQQLCADFKNLFMEPNFGDVSINVGGKTLWANKHVLMARSKVFATKFKTDISESNTNTVTITDFSYETIHALLKYIYFGITDKQVNHVELFKIAARYELKILQRDCELLLCEDVNLDNATSLLLLTEDYYAPMLKFGVLSSLREATFNQYN